MSSAESTDLGCGHAGMTVVAWIGVAASVIIFVVLRGIWNDGSLVLGLLSFLIIGYVTFTSAKARAARIHRDRGKIRNAHGLVRQCGATLDKIDSSLREADLERVGRLLGQLYDRVGLFLAQYGNYLHPGAADIVWDMENSIAGAGDLEVDDLRMLVPMLRDRLDAIQSSVLDVCNPMLRDIRNKM